MSLLHLTYVEMRRALHRRVVWWMNVLALAGIALTGAIVFSTSANPEFGFLEPSHPANMVNWTFAGANGGFLGLAAGFLALGAAVCGASYAGAEWRAGTITTVLTWTPSRWRMHTARTLSAFILSFVIAVGLQIVFLGALLPAVAANGSSDGTDAEWWKNLFLDITRVSLVTAILAVLAVSIATIGRNTAPALVVIAAWALIGEPLVANLVKDLAPWLITPNVILVLLWGSADDDFDFTRSPETALVTLVVYVLAVAVVAWFSFDRRDIVGSS